VRRTTVLLGILFQKIGPLHVTEKLPNFVEDRGMSGRLFDRDRSLLSATTLMEKLLYCIVFKYLNSAAQQPWANRGTFGSISSKKRDKF